MGRKESNQTKFNPKKVKKLSGSAHGKFFKIPAKKTKINKTGPDQTVSEELKQSDQGLPCLLFCQQFVNSGPENQHFI